MTVTPLSVLDLAPISAGSDAATALRNTIDLAGARAQSLRGGVAVTVTPLSVLDLAPISAGSDAATALRNTIDLA
ncbi:MAG: hypothetical protein ACXVYA_02940, partial [Mycobacterium sp.]